MKRGPDLDIEAIFTDLESDRPAPAIDPADDVEVPADGVDLDDPDEFASDESLSDDEERERG
jgi:hypothetical protein